MTASASADAWRPVYRAGWQGRKVAALWTGFLLVTAGFAAMAWLADTPATRTAGAILTGVMALFAVAMEVYRRLYVAALDEAPGRRLRVQTARFGLVRWTEYPAGALAPGRVRTGEWEGDGMSGQAPWLPLRRPGHRLPLLVDLQGDVLDAAAFARLARAPRGGR